MAEFPPEHCRVVASAAMGDDGFVLLDTGSPGSPYLYAASVMRTADGWIDGVSSNGLSWALTDEEHDLGTLAAWDEAPPGADRVRVVLYESVHEVAVTNGVYLVVWWRQPYPPAGAHPRAVACRINGVWEVIKPWAPGASDGASGA
jgi:hypothetical protein